MALRRGRQTSVEQLLLRKTSMLLAPGPGAPRGHPRLSRRLHLLRRFAMARRTGAISTQSKSWQRPIQAVPFTKSRRYMLTIVSQQSTTRLGNHLSRQSKSKTAQAPGRAPSGLKEIGTGLRLCKGRALSKSRLALVRFLRTFRGPAALPAIRRQPFAGAHSHGLVRIIFFLRGTTSWSVEDPGSH